MAIFGQEVSIGSVDKEAKDTICCLLEPLAALDNLDMMPTPFNSACHLDLTSEQFELLRAFSA